MHSLYVPLYQPYIQPIYTYSLLKEKITTCRFIIKNVLDMWGIDDDAEEMNLQNTEKRKSFKKSDTTNLNNKANTTPISNL